MTGVTCSYDEVWPFKGSAAKAAIKSHAKQDIVNQENRLIQITVDNLDNDIYYPNVNLSTIPWL